MVDVLFLPSFCIILNLGNLSVYQKKKDRDLTYKEYLKLQEELNAYFKLGIKDEVILETIHILANKLIETYHKYYNLKAAYITAVKEQIKIMVLLLSMIPLLKTPELREKEKLIEASAIEIVLMKEKNKLNFQEKERLNKRIDNLFLISPPSCGEEYDLSAMQEKINKAKDENDVLPYNVLQKKINQAEDAYAVAEEEIYQLLVKIFI